MIDISAAGLTGAVLGTVIAALIYGRLVAVIESSLRKRGRSERGAQSVPLEQELLRRIVLATDIVIFAGVGYWLGGLIGG